MVQKASQVPRLTVKALHTILVQIVIIAHSDMHTSSGYNRYFRKSKSKQAAQELEEPEAARNERKQRQLTGGRKLLGMYWERLHSRTFVANLAGTISFFHSVQWINALAVIFRGYPEAVPPVIAAAIKPRVDEPPARREGPKQVRCPRGKSAASRGKSAPATAESDISDAYDDISPVGDTKASALDEFGFGE